MALDSIRVLNFHFLTVAWIKNVIIFGVAMSSSVHIDKKKDILILGSHPTQGLDDNTVTAEAQYSISFSR